MPEAEHLVFLSDFLSNGSISAVFAMLLIFIVGLGIDRMRLIRKNDKDQETLLDNKEKELESVKAIIEKYHEGNLNLSKTLSEIKIVLENIQRK